MRFPTEIRELSDLIAEIINKEDSLNDVITKMRRVIRNRDGGFIAEMTARKILQEWREGNPIGKVLTFYKQEAIQDGYLRLSVFLRSYDIKNDDPRILILRKTLGEDFRY